MNNTNLTEEQDSHYNMKDFTWFQFYLPPVTTEEIKPTPKVEEAEPFETRYFFEFLQKQVKI